MPHFFYYKGCPCFQRHRHNHVIIKTMPHIYCNFFTVYLYLNKNVVRTTGNKHQIAIDRILSELQFSCLVGSRPLSASQSLEPQINELGIKTKAKDWYLTIRNMDIIYRQCHATRFLNYCIISSHQGLGGLCEWLQKLRPTYNFSLCIM